MLDLHQHDGLASCRLTLNATHRRQTDDNMPALKAAFASKVKKTSLKTQMRATIRSRLSRHIVRLRKAAKLTQAR